MCLIFRKSDSQNFEIEIQKKMHILHKYEIKE